MANISQLHIRRYRGICDLVINQLGVVNLIVGDNNCGKTSVLEAMQLFRTSGGLANVYKIARQRELIAVLSGNSIYENIICMFPHDGSNLEIELSGVCNGKSIEYSLNGTETKVLIDTKELEKTSYQYREDTVGELETDAFDGVASLKYGLEEHHEEIHINRFSRISGIAVRPNEHLKIVYVSPFEHLKGNVISQIVKNDAYKEICLSALQLFDKNIEDMMVFRSDVGNRPVEYLKHKKLGNMPLSTYGDGIKKVLALSNAIAMATGGILLIDEIETAIHKKYYDDIFQFVVKACEQFDVQVFISTHSIEAIDGILSTQGYDNQEITDNIQVVTLKRGEDRTYSRVLSGREVYSNREAFGFEVRL